ncbi:sterol desaturase family protein [Acidocella sp. KAb 2-4]|uniref:sterol desaturase family protein n=1 Tax=Acidocella sp. KAb 2-4 TaxID=2885158 RepID=UPI001D0993E0|nr:sterol desaturase family protein [Acidocella sp. KAb 2-4]MCB5943892.1 sterol desaturase family protein [Acidocella sp. KAb 2-4]
MAKKFVWGRAWHGRSYDLGRMTLPELWVAYLTYPAINLYVALALLAGAYAVLEARRGLEIAMPALAVLIVYPLVWYGLHRYVLHGRWLYRMRWSAGLWKRIHFDHHQDPHKLEVLFGDPLNTIPTMALITGPIGYALAGWTGAAAAFATALITTCVYEFFHCIQHLNYKPKNAFVQRLKRDHLLHHFHSETVNYGIVSFLPDKMLGTYHPNAKDCPKSPTVFNLGYDLDEAARFPWVMELTGAPPRDKPPGAMTEQRGRAA